MSTAEDTSKPASTSRRRSTVLNLIFSYLGIFISLAYGILLVPLYMNSMSVALYGAWLATGNVLAWIELIDPGVASLLQQRVSFLLGGNNKEQLPETIGTGVVIGLALGALPLLGLPIAELLPAWLGLDPVEAGQLSLAFRVGLIGLAVTLATYPLTAICLGAQQSMAVGVGYLAAGVLGLVATAVLLLSDWGLVALPLGMLTRSVTLFVWAGFVAWRWWSRSLPDSPRFSRRELRHLGSTMSFTFVARLGGAMLGRLDALVSSQLGGAPAAAVLSLSGRAYEPVRTLGDRVGPAFLPGLASLAGQGAHGRLEEVATRMIRIVGWVTTLGVACVVSLNEAFVALWVGPEVFGGVALSSAIGMATAFSIQIGLLGQVVFALGGIRRTSALAFGEAAIKLPLQLGLFAVLGLVGMPVAAIVASLLVSSIALPLIAASLSGTPRRVYLVPMWTALTQTAVLSALGLGAGTLASRMVDTWTWGAFVVAAAAIALLLSAVLLALDASLRGTLATFIRGRLARRGQTSSEAVTHAMDPDV